MVWCLKFYLCTLTSSCCAVHLLSNKQKHNRKRHYGYWEGGKGEIQYPVINHYGAESSTFLSRYELSPLASTCYYCTPPWGPGCYPSESIISSLSFKVNWKGILVHGIHLHVVLAVYYQKCLIRVVMLGAAEWHAVNHTPTITSLLLNKSEIRCKITQMAQMCKQRLPSHFFVTWIHSYSHTHRHKISWAVASRQERPKNSNNWLEHMWF